VAIRTIRIFGRAVRTGGASTGRIGTALIAVR
jgi:hypothetical protein